MFKTGIFLMGIFSAATAQRGGHDTRLGFIGDGEQEFAHKFRTNSYVTIGNQTSVAGFTRTQNLIGDGSSINHELLWDLPVRRVAQLGFRIDGMGQTASQFDRSINKYGNYLANAYAVYPWCFLRNLSGCDIESYNWWKPNAPALADADIPDIYVAQLTDRYYNRQNQVAWEIGNEPNLWPSIEPKEYAALYNAYAKKIRITEPNAKLVLGAVFMNETINPASRKHLVSILNQQANKKVNNFVDVGFSAGNWLTRMVLSPITGPMKDRLLNTVMDRTFRYTSRDYLLEVYKHITDRSLYPDVISVHAYHTNYDPVTHMDAMKWTTQTALSTMGTILTDAKNKFGGETELWVTEYGNLNYKLDEEEASKVIEHMTQEFLQHSKFYGYPSRIFMYKPMRSDPMAAKLLPNGATPFSRLISDQNYTLPAIPKGEGRDPFPCHRLNRAGNQLYRLASGGYDCLNWSSWNPED